MNTNLKKIITGTAVAVAMIFSSSVFSSAHAASYQVILDNIVAIDDADYQVAPSIPGVHNSFKDRAGDIKLRITVNGIELFSNMKGKSIYLDDRDKNKFVFNGKNRKVHDGVLIKIDADEYDGGTANENCSGFDAPDIKKKIYAYELICKPGKDLELKLSYIVKKL